MPCYFRSVLADGTLNLTGYLKHALGELLQCNLAFGNDIKDWGDVCDVLDNGFLCATVDDDELPWDLEEVDW